MARSPMTWLLSAATLTLAAGALARTAPAPAADGAKAPKAKADSVLDFKMKNIDGREVALADYKGDVLLVVNVASKCGLTPQYEQLEAVFEKYKGQGFKVLAFPANEFGKQEPGTDAQIKQFCSENYNVTFPVFSKIVVMGEGIHPLYDFLTSKETDPKFAGKISWNFTKFLVDRKGDVIARFEPKVKPDDPKVIEAVEKALAEKK